MLPALIRNRYPVPILTFLPGKLLSHVAERPFWYGTIVFIVCSVLATVTTPLASEQWAEHRFIPKRPVPKYTGHIKLRSLPHAPHRHVFKRALTQPASLVFAPDPVSPIPVSSPSFMPTPLPTNVPREPAQPRASILSFTAEPRVIHPGGATSICVVASNARKLVISTLGQWRGSVMCVDAYPLMTTTYTATAIDPHGQGMSRNVRVTVAEAVAPVPTPPIHPLPAVARPNRRHHHRHRRHRHDIVALW